MVYLDDRWLHLRAAQRTDYSRVLSVIDDWWGGRQMSLRLSHVFFSHFSTTSYVIDAGDELAAFLLGFLSQSDQTEAYIHFIGVHPAFRRLAIGTRLYGRFFTAAAMQGRTRVRSITSSGNRASIAFHQALGFTVEHGDTSVDGIPVHLDYAGPGGHRVVFSRRVAAFPHGAARRVPAQNVG